MNDQSIQPSSGDPLGGGQPPAAQPPAGQPAGVPQPPPQQVQPPQPPAVPPQAPVPAAAPPPAAPAGFPVKRSLGRVIGFTILSMGIYGYYWFYQTRRQVTQQLGTNDQVGLQTAGLLVPILNYFIIYWLWRDINRADRSVGGTGFNVGLYLALAIVGGLLTFGIVTFVIYILVLQVLNGFWDRRTQGQATDAPITSGEIAVVAIGFVAMLLYVIFIVVIMIASIAASNDSSSLIAPLLGL